MFRAVMVMLAAMTATVVSAGPAAAAQPGARAIKPVDKALSQRLAAGMAEANRASKVYIVQMVDDPALTYAGGVTGFAKTAPAKGERYNARSGEAIAYAERLGMQQDAALARVGASDRKIYSFRHAMNGFAARLSAVEASKLRKDKTVRRVWEDQKFSLQTNNSPTFLGLNDPQKGLRKKLKLRGKGVIIGVMDSGAIQEHPSFDDTGMPAPPAHWAGICQPGEAWAATDCNNKLIGARYYNAGFLAVSPIEPADFLSARDSDGHGTHTATTAGGRETTASLNGTPLAKVSGMAPLAHIAVYKPCWEDLGGDQGAGCFFSDSAAATDAAVADGVDILSFSVGTAASFTDPQDIAFLFAADAGVFVSRSAGNSGPTPGSTAAGEPWVTTVAASTHNGQAFANATRVNAPASLAGNLPSLEGATTAPLVITGPVTSDLAAASPIDACTPIGAVGGKTVLIMRGGCAFDTKLTNAVNAGAGAALVFTNELAPGVENPKTVMGGSLSFPIPGVMIDNAPGAAIAAALAAGTTVNVTLSAEVFIREKIHGNIMAGFSSRGPFLTEQNWVKPDVTAPGVRVLAGHTPEPNDGSPGDYFQYLQGTSMSTPHVSGIAALLIEAHPDWTPGQVKSALMTTARQNIVKEDGATPADPFDFGSGHIDPNKAIDPGLTYDAGGLLDYAAATCGTAEPLLDDADCALLESVGYILGAANLNLPSIGMADVVGTQTVTRRVTNVGTRRATYTASYTAPPGFKVQIKPNKLTLNPGESASFTVTLKNNGAPAGEYRFGRMVWRDGKGHVVRSPIVARAQTLVAPEGISGVGPDGGESFDVTFGYAGAYTAGVHGLVDGFPFLLTNVPDDPDNTFDFGAGVGELGGAYPVPPGTNYIQFSMFDAYTDGNHDFDSYLFYCPADPAAPCPLVDQSAGATSEETVGVGFPNSDPAGDFYVWILHAFQTEGGAPASLIPFDWVYPGAVGDEGNMTVTAPGSAVLGATGTVNVSWSGLSSGPLAKQVGAISHNDGSGPIGLTTINVASDGGATFCDVVACPP